jgi:uncharacterized protein
MRWLLIGAISLYRCLPAFFRRKCLFKETCSAHVLRIAYESGLRLSLVALRKRVSQCRPGYSVFFDADINCWRVCFADGSVANSAQVAGFVLEPYSTLPVQTWTTNDNSAPVGNLS